MDLNDLFLEILATLVLNRSKSERPLLAILASALMYSWVFMNLVIISSFSNSTLTVLDLEDLGTAILKSVRATWFSLMTHLGTPLVGPSTRRCF